jgi:Zn-dependent protease
MEVMNLQYVNTSRFSTSQIEVRDIITAWLLLSVAFAILQTGGIFNAKFLPGVLMAAFTVGTGFLLHELGHKLVAQHYGCRAEFRAFRSMLWLSLAMSFFGFIFAAPGAVMIEGRVTRQESGRISAMGPLMNVILGSGFLALYLIKPMTIFQYGMSINAWLGLFNMLPFSIIDGAKIWQWNKPAYFMLVAACAGLMFVSGVV